MAQIGDVTKRLNISADTLRYYEKSKNGKLKNKIDMRDTTHVAHGHKVNGKDDPNGKDLVVVWDAEDPAFDVFLEAGLSVARALCTRAVAARESQTADFESIERAVRAVEKLGGGLGEIHNWSESIRNNSEKILNKVRTMRKELVRQVETLDERFDDLKTALDPDAAGA